MWVNYGLKWKGANIFDAFELLPQCFTPAWNNTYAAVGDDILDLFNSRVANHRPTLPPLNTIKSEEVNVVVPEENARSDPSPPVGGIEKEKKTRAKKENK